MSQTTPCFHCGLPVPDGAAYSAVIAGEERPMCCPGCAAVARAIDVAGLADYYRHRTANPRSRRDTAPADLARLSVYDDERVQKSFVEIADEKRRRASLVLEGIECAACIWLNERHLTRLPGVIDVSINYATRQATVEWDNERVQLSGILAAIAAIGYQAHPYDPRRQEIALRDERRRLLRQIGVAAAFGMQVMVLAVALYAGDWYGMDAEFEQYFRRFSLLLTLPVLVYSGRGFFRNALTDLRLGRVSMDVPVSLALGLAFVASTWHVIIGAGAVYFESICMFIAFLLAARYFELASRMRAITAADAIGYIEPAPARRLRDRREDGKVQIVPAVELAAGDLVQVRPGEAVPADGVIVSGRSAVDESLLTGESLPRPREPADAVIGGSINTTSPVVVRVTRTGDDTVLAGIHRLIGRAFSGKPAIAALADRVAGYFVVAVLAITTAVALFWWRRDPSAWFEIALAVLVVSCPCALSLAVPTALSSAVARLMRSRILVTSGCALETLHKATVFAFDKTGTLTLGRPRVRNVAAFGLPARNALAVADALEAGSEHPLAAALRGAAHEAGAPALTAREVVNTPGEGVSGIVGGRRYVLGNQRLVESAGIAVPDGGAAVDDGATGIFLADEERVVAYFAVADRVRPESAEVVSQLKARGLRVALVSGDNESAARRVAAELGIDEVFAGRSPAAKLEQVRCWQAAGEVVAMVGDGVNDAPVLAGADVSISAGGASAVAAASADIVVLAHDLAAVVTARDTASRTMRILRQNLAWAIGYNLLAVPLAAAGLVPPWLAALGMSASSLLVVGNAGRLRVRRADANARARPETGGEAALGTAH